MNQALLSANLGRLMRSCAHAYGLQRPKEIEVCAKQEKMWEYSQQEKLYYSKSVEYYLDAKLVGYDIRHTLYISVIKTCVLQCYRYCDVSLLILVYGPMLCLI